jgi:predicted transcriptional regulator
MPDSTVVVRVDDELKTAFARAAKAADRTTSQLLRDFMRDFVKSKTDEAEHDAWFRRKVAEGIADARAGNVVSSEEVEAEFAERRAATLRKIGQRE